MDFFRTFETEIANLRTALIGILLHRFWGQKCLKGAEGLFGADFDVFLEPSFLGLGGVKSGFRRGQTEVEAGLKN